MGTNQSGVRTLVRADTYRDSVALMRIAATLEALPGVDRAAAMMATPANRELLSQAGFDATSWASARPTDLLVAVRGAEAAVVAALDLASALLDGHPSVQADRGQSARELPRTLHQAVADLPGANLALISVPGPYAAAEALKALKHGLHVFCFSDNVALADEVRLKRLAAERGLLLMGPDCGTAVIDGVPLGFANAVRRGPVGLVGASGTGMQEVMCLLDRAGVGISQAIGVGSRDLGPEVGGLMLRTGLGRLGADPETGVIVAISKPPDPATAAAVLREARNLTKPVVVCFLGAPVASEGRIMPAATLEEAAERAAQVARGTLPGGEPPAHPALPEGASARSTLPPRSPAHPALPEGAGELPSAPVGRQGTADRAPRILGLFSGGTLCVEAAIILRTILAPAHPSTAWELLDLGDDRFTVGRPHPMIDPRERALRVQEAGADPTVRVLLLDVVLGFGAHEDPAGALAPAIAAARASAAADGRELAVVASITGTSADPQGFERQQRTLRAAGTLVAPSNAAAARLAIDLLTGGHSGD